MKKENHLTTFAEIETFHPSYPIEWWFFNGFIENPRYGKHYFMVSFFRHKIFDDKNSKNSFALLFSLLNSQTGETKILSQVDNQIIQDAIRGFEEKTETELDYDLVKVLVKELKQHGPPEPIELTSVKVNHSQDQIEIEWEQCKLKQTLDELILEIPFWNEKTLRLELTPERRRIDLMRDENVDDIGGKMSYSCYPKLGIDCSLENEPFSGKAWMDHQWGDTHWIMTDSKNQKILGWDWFGINLEDGTDILILIHKYAKTNKEIHSRAIIIPPKGEPNLSKDFRIKPIEFWTSPITHIQYPTRWEITLNDCGIYLKFDPINQNQEIQVFGISRAIWEGAGIVTGSRDGKKIEGRARGEFFGYGYIFDFQNYLEKLADRVDKRIEEFFPKIIDENQIEKYIGKPFWKNEPIAYTELLSKPIWDLILRRGKRWRPIFGILMCEALGKSSEYFEGSACLAELIHSGALIIDDIEDNSPLRRGDKSLHVKYGLDVALNAGNTLYFLPTVSLFTHEHLDDKKKLRIQEIMMQTYLKAHFGQTLDIYWSRNMSSKNLNVWVEDEIEDKILQMYDYKTASGPKGLTEVAAVIAEVDDEILGTAIDFSRAFAVAFQIIDDVHNFSASPRWTKVCGEDLKNGKLTYVIAKAIKILRNNEREKFIKVLTTEELRTNEETLQEAIEIIRNSGVLEICKEEAKKMSLTAWEKFSDLVPSREAKIMLNMLTLKMLDLAYDT